MNYVAPGSQVAGRYRVVRTLGAGGMGTVVEATHVQLAQRVAIKFLLPSLCSQRDAVIRFLREARAAVRLESEHVARVTDVGTTDDGVPFLVMEYLEGLDLSVLLQREGRLPIELAVSMVVQACDAIAEAHSLGIIHRDLKPSNLFLTTRRDGNRLLKVLDFGISKALAEVSDAGALWTRTATATVMGSPHYMSPEQLRSSKNVDPRADIWSLGVILHELIGGEPPFKGESLPGVLASIVVDAPASLSTLRPDVPPALEAVVLRCLEKDREQRYGSIPELARALAPFAPPEAQSVLMRVYSFAQPEQTKQWSSLTPTPTPGAAQLPVGALARGLSPPSPTDAASAPPVGVSVSPHSDTTRGFSLPLGPKQTRQVGLVLVGALGVLTAAFAYVGYGSSRASKLTPTPTPQAAVAPSTTAPPVATALKISNTPLTATRWEAIEQARGSVSKVAPPGSALDDARLFAERK